MTDDCWKLLSILIQAFAALAVGFAATFVAYQQWRVARQQCQLAQQKFKYDLYERRYKVYEAAKRFLNDVISNGGIDDSGLHEFIRGISEAGFLFPPDFVKYLKSLWQREKDRRRWKRDSEALPNCELRYNYIKEESQALKWMLLQWEGLTDKFHPYLGFSEHLD